MSATLKRIATGSTLLLLLLAFSSAPALSQDEADTVGQGIWKEKCAQCHEGGDERAPTREALREFEPESIVVALTTGPMQFQGLPLTGAQRRAVAGFLSDLELSTDEVPANQGMCASTPAFKDPLSGPHWNGWGPTVEATHFQPGDQAGLEPEDVPKLKLAWAFGFKDSSSAWSQPTVAGGRIFVGSQAGTVFSIDAKTGCTYWKKDLESSVRSAISVGKVKDSDRWAIYFGDLSAHAHALDAATGEKIWDVKVEDHDAARITGSPVLHDDVLYVPVSSWEEASGARPDYSCCTFRGSVVAVDAQTGAIRWKSYTIPEEPKERGKSAQGATLYGPAGGAIWSSPTVDAKRGVVYAGVGNTYSPPAHPNTDAVLAFDMRTGEIRWSKQATPGDVFIIGCGRGENPNCPEEVGPDLDFGTSPIIAKTPSGKDLIVIGQKAGVAWALDPDKKGEVVWQYRAGDGGPLGGIEWGTAVDGKYAYVPVSDLFRAHPGGLHAVDLETGKRVWYTPPPEMLCKDQRGCTPAQSAAITVIPGIVFSGSLDGGFRAYNADTGEIVWQFDTNPEFDTVNGVPAHGGSLVGPGPTVVDGMVYVNSGYGALGGRPGNVLLAFSVQ